MDSEDLDPDPEPPDRLWKQQCLCFEIVIFSTIWLDLHKNMEDSPGQTLTIIYAAIPRLCKSLIQTFFQWWEQLGQHYRNFAYLCPIFRLLWKREVRGSQVTPPETLLITTTPLLPQTVTRGQDVKDVATTAYSDYPLDSSSLPGIFPRSHHIQWPSVQCKQQHTWSRVKECKW